MVKKGISPDDWSYNILIDGLAKSGRVREANRIFWEMQDFDIAPSVITYNSLLYGFCKACAVEEAKLLVKDMNRRGCLPNQRTFNIMIDALCKTRKVEEAYKLLSKMIEDGHDPDVFTYNTLICGLCELSKVDEAYRVLQQMLQRNCRATVVTQNTLIHGLCKAGRIGDAWNVLNGMISHGLSPNVISTTRSFTGSAEQEMQTKLSSFSPSWFLSERCDLHRTDFGAVQGESSSRGLCAVFRLMHDCGCAANLFTYTAMILGLCSSGRLDDGLKLLGEMVCEGIAPDHVVFGTVAAELCKRGNAGKANEILREAREKDWKSSGSSSSVEAYQRATAGLLNTGKLNEALLLVKEMIREGEVPSPETSASLVAALCKNRRVGESKLLLREIMKLAYGESCGNAAAFVKTMIEQGFRIDPEDFEALAAEE